MLQCIRELCMLLCMADIGAEQRGWLLHLSESTGLSLTEIARKAGMAQTTLTRFANNPNVAHVLSARTISQIEQALGVPFGQAPGARLEARGRPAGEAEPYHGHNLVDPDIATVLAALPASWEPWLLHGDALTAAGYLPGDVLVVDPDGFPSSKDVCRVSVDQGPRVDRRTCFRIYETPFVVASSHDPHAEGPLLVDQAKVRITGVVRMLLRPRRTRAIAA